MGCWKRTPSLDVMSDGLLMLSDVATDSRLRVVRVVIVTAIASIRNKRESSLKAAITAPEKGAC